MSVLVLAVIERTHAFQPIRKPKHFGIGLGLLCIVVTGLPMLLHRAPGEFKILGDAFVGPRSIDQMDDIADLVVSFTQQQLGIIPVA